MNSRSATASLLFLFTSLLVSSLTLNAQTASADESANTAPRFVMTWKANNPGCDDKYVDGTEVRSQFTDQAVLMISLFRDLNKLAVHALIANLAKNSGRLEVVPENIRLFKATDKGLVELHRSEAATMAKSMERRQRIAAGLSGFSAGMNETTATATSSDGTRTTVTTPNTQAQSDAVNHAREDIGAAQELGAKAISKELKRNTLEPGQDVVGRLFFPNEKGGESLVVQITLGVVRYDFPFTAPKK